MDQDYTPIEMKNDSAPMGAMPVIPPEMLAEQTSPDVGRRKTGWLILVGVAVLVVAGGVAWTKLGQQPTDLPETRNENQVTSEQQPVASESTELTGAVAVGVAGEGLLTQIMDKSQYTLKLQQSIEGQVLEFELMRRGEDMSVSVPALGFDALLQDGKAYVLNRTMESVTEVAIQDENLASVMPMQTTQLGGVVSTSTQELDGVTYDVENYAGVRAYFLGSELKYLRDIATDSLYKVLSYSEQVNEDLFVVPADWEVVSL